MIIKGKKILILGNGFDLAHGLPTRYINFLEFCEKLCRIYSYRGKDAEYYRYYIEDWNINEEIKDKIMDAFKSTVVETTMIDTQKHSKVCSPDPVIQEIWEHLGQNIVCLYLEKLHKWSKLKGENWIDFESEISFIIQFIDKAFDNLSNPIELLRDKLGSIDRRKDINSEKLDLFLKVLTAERADNRDEFELPIKHLQTIKDLREKLYSDLEKLIRVLELYLVNFVEKLPVNLISEDIKGIEPDYIISFNYTNTYERLYANGKSVFYIHGKCSESSNLQDNNMVLGIDEYWPENEQDIHTNYTIFKKFAQRIRKKTGIENYEYIEEMNTAFSSSGHFNTQNEDGSKDYTVGTTKIYVFGHSLDVSDKDILSDFLGSDATVTTIFCHDKGVEGELIANVIKIIGERNLLKKVNQSPPKIMFKTQKEMVLS